MEKDEEEEKPKDRFAQAMELVEGRLVEVFINEGDREPYMAVWVENPPTSGIANIPIRSKEADAWINTLFFQATGRGLGEDTRDEVRASLEAKAWIGELRRPLELLAWVDPEERRILVDLGTWDWKVVEITPEGWGIVDLGTVTPFRRSPLLQPLPIEKVEASPEECRALLSTLVPLTVEEDLKETFTTFFPPWLCCVLITNIPRPGLLFIGPHGSGKSTAQRRIMKLFTGVEVQGITIRDPKDLAVKLSSSPLLALDNVGKIPSEVASALSMAVTGGGWIFRRLYTDAEVRVLQVKRVVLLNGINPGVVRYPDLMDRLVVVPLRRLEPGERREERELEEEFVKLRPRILGVIFSSLSRGLRHLEEVRTELRGRKTLPRMTDFAIWGEAIARGMGYQPLEWLKAYAKLMEEAVELVLEHDPLAQAILKLANKLRENLDDGRRWEEAEEYPAEGHGWWIGTATKLLEELEKLAGEEESLVDLREEGFPKNARALSQKLRGLAPELQEKGIRIAFLRKGKEWARLILVRVREADATDGADANC